MSKKKSWLHFGSASAAGAVVAGLTFGAGLIPSGSARESFPLTPASFDDQVESYVVTSLEHNARAKSYGEWESSGFTPQDIFQNIAAYKSSAAWQALCAKLKPLGDDDLALFEDELARRPEVPCLAPLAARLAAYWEAQRHSLRLHLKDETPVILPSQERHVDASHGETLIRGGLKDGEIAITLDDGPHFARTPRILKTLADSHVRATFFSVGQMAQRHPELARQAVAEGHTFASHSWDHADLAKLDVKSADQSIIRGAKAVADAAGVDVPFFRFPYGSRSRVTAEFVHARPMASFLWNIDSRDWAIRKPALLLENVIRELDHAKGGIALFHDIQEQTAIVMPLVMKELAKRRFTTIVFVPH